MTWDEIMKIQDPHKALIQIDKKIGEEKLSIQDMEDAIEKYTQIHGITQEEMAFYPSGDRVILAVGVYNEEEPTE